MAQTKAERSAAAKKAAETRRRKAAEKEQESSSTDPQEAEVTEDQTAPEPYRPTHKPLANAGLDQRAVEEDRQKELAEEREAHNKRTGDGSLRDSDGPVARAEGWNH